MTLQKKENKRSWPSNSHFFSKGMTSLKKEIWYVWPLLKKWELEGPTLPRKVKLRYVWPFLKKVKIWQVPRKMEKLVFFTPRRKQFPHRSFFLGMVLRSLVKVGWILIGLECTVCLFFKDFCCYAKRPSLFWGLFIDLYHAFQRFSVVLVCLTLRRGKAFFVGKATILRCGNRIFEPKPDFQCPPKPVFFARPNSFSIPGPTTFSILCRKKVFLEA